MPSVFLFVKDGSSLDGVTIAGNFIQRQGNFL